MTLTLNTDLFAFADIMDAEDVRAVVRAIFRNDAEGLTDAQRIAFAPFGATFERVKEHKANVSKVRSEAATKVHQAKAATKPQTTPPRPTAFLYEKDPFFVDFWKIYPRKKNVSKKDAFRFYLKLSEAEKAQVNEAAKAFAIEMRGKDEQYIPHPSTYINGRRWETIKETTKQQTTNTTKAL